MPLPAGWVEGIREIRFTFGEYRVGAARFRAWTSDRHFLACDERMLESLPAFDQVPAAIDVLVVPSLPVTTDLPKIGKPPGALRYVLAHFNHYCIELGASFEDYLARLSGKSRHEMARKVRRFLDHAAGRHEIREYRDSSAMREFLELAGALSRTTYQGRLLDAGLPQGPEFLAELEAAAARDDVRGWILLLEGRAVAFGYCRAAGDVMLFEHTGYDPALAQHSPGIFLLHAMLSQVFGEKRFRVFDFGTGDAQYKRSYATTSRRCAAVWVFRRNLRNRMIVGTHRALTGFSDGCVRFLKTLGIKDRVRRLLRRSRSS
jgi:CelD/BcsL family acetyltransferase involved in cellulose biosynthesis